MDQQETATPEALWKEVAAERSADTASQPSQAKPVDKPAVQAAPVETPKPAEPAKPTTEQLLAEALARVEKLEGRTRNVEGQYGTLNRQQLELQQRVSAANTAAATVKDAPTAEQIKKAAANPEQWEALKGDFPEWSAATEIFVDHKLKGLNPGADVDTVNQLVASAVKAARDEITTEVRKQIVDDSLNAVFPGWRDEQPKIKEWVKTQSPEVMAWADSANVGDAAKVLSAFYAAKKANPAQQVLEKREQKLNAAVAAPRGSRPAPGKTPDQMTTQELWEYEKRLRAKRNATA